MGWKIAANGRAKSSHFHADVVTLNDINPETGKPYKTNSHKRKKNKEWREANLERCKELEKKYAKTEKSRENRNASSRRARLAFIEGYGGKCECCGESNTEFLGIDHIGGGGGKERREGLTSQRLYRKLAAQGFPRKNHRLLCHNCNLSYGAYGYCPHQLPKLERV